MEEAKCDGKAPHFVLLPIFRCKVNSFCHFSDFIIDFLCEISDFHASLVALALFLIETVPSLTSFHPQWANKEYASFHCRESFFRFFRAVINYCSNIAVIQLTANFVGIVIIFVWNREDNHLVWSQPQWEMTGGMFNEDSHKTFHWAKWCTVNHHRAMFWLSAPVYSSWKRSGRL